MRTAQHPTPNLAAQKFYSFTKTILMSKNKTARPDDTHEETAIDRLDLTDSKRDQERLQPDETTIDLPDVSDIPGQEHVHVPPLGELADTTISSDDEEGKGLFVDDIEDETYIRTGTTDDEPTDDKIALRRAGEYLPTEDDTRLQNAALDETDDEGARLNEEGFDRDKTGKDLDVPGAELDDADENSGEEDEENNSYSLGSDSNDSLEDEIR
jgi:hypothetical protein